uniref:SV2 related protein n=1 Tax=Callorhinchus milii TaxID=7868 RepID=A0A4W3JHR9_CALMI
MDEDLFQLRHLPVVKFRRTGESARSEDDTCSGEHEIEIEGVRTNLEPVELEDGTAVPKDFANPTDGRVSQVFDQRAVCNVLVHLVKLRWLPITERIDFEILTLVFISLHAL